MSLTFVRQAPGRYHSHVGGHDGPAWRITRIGGPKGKYWQLWLRLGHDGEWVPRRWFDQTRPTSLKQAVAIATKDSRSIYAYGPSAIKEPA